jgi:hypothetical protein
MSKHKDKEHTCNCQPPDPKHVHALSDRILEAIGEYSVEERGVKVSEIGSALMEVMFSIGLKCGMADAHVENAMHQMLHSTLPGPADA